MKKDEITQGNILIDQFNDFYLQRAGFTPNEFSYHSDWNNLMMVVERVATVKGRMNKDFCLREICECWSCIEDVHEGVVQFIKSYNKKHA